MLKSGGDVAFRETLYLMALTFGRLHTCREAFGRVLGLTASQFIVLIGTAYQQGSEGVSIRALADHTQLAATHVTTEVGRLIGKGLLTKQASTRDRRSVLVRLSPKGEDAIRAVNPAARRVNDLLFADVSREDFAAVSPFSKDSRSTANMRSRKSGAPTERAARPATQGRIEFAAGPCPRRGVHHPLRAEHEERDVGTGTLGSAICGAGLSFRHRAERLSQEQGRSAEAGPEGALDCRRRGPQWRLSRRAGPRRSDHGFLADRAGKGSQRWPRPRRDDPHRAGRPRYWQWPVEAFDVVVAIFFQFCAPHCGRGCSPGIKRALKPGGLLLMEGYTPKQRQYKTGGPSEVENLYTRELLETVVCGFLPDRDRGIRQRNPRRPGHGGMSALIDLVGRK
jgi:DNA-binding MarR family transcriptional regulator